MAAYCLLAGICSAARPFDRLPADDPAYSRLTALSSAGLLAGIDLSGAELSRLEAAVLFQKALNNYALALLNGEPADPALEAALTELGSDFSAELTQLGIAPPLAFSVPGDRADDAATALEEAGPEEEAAEDAAADEAEADGESAAEGDAVAVTTSSGIAATLYGSFQIHGRAEETSYMPHNVVDRTDASVYWGELGVDLSGGDYSGRCSMLFNDSSDEVRFYEGWAQYTHPRNGLFLKAGQMLMPFGDNDYYFPTYPAVNDLSFITAEGLGGGFTDARWDFSVYVYDPRVQTTYDQDNVTDFTAVLALHRAADDCHDGYKLVAGYNTHLGSNDLRIAGEGPHLKRVPAYNVFGRYDWSGNRYHLLADYTAALQAFDPAELDIDADGVGDQPAALNCEFVYEPEPDTLWGVNYQATRQLPDYAARRIGALYGRRLSELALLKLEYTHGEYGDFVTAGQTTDDVFVAEVSIDF